MISAEEARQKIIKNQYEDLKNRIAAAVENAETYIYYGHIFEENLIELKELGYRIEDDHYIWWGKRIR